jgi:hypothetical protein
LGKFLKGIDTRSRWFFIRGADTAMPINERQWQGRVLNIIHDLIREHPEWRFSRVEQEVEVRVGGVQRRYTDPVIYNGDGHAACLLELKLPDRPDGRSPRYRPVVEKTFEKALHLGTPYLVTWNVNSAVLWKLEVPGRLPHERSLRQYDVTAIRSSDDLNRADVARQIQEFLERLLRDLYEIHVGVAVAVPQPLDESVVHTIQTYIDPMLVGTLQAEVTARYRRSTRFADDLRRWAVDEQGWTWDDTPRGLPESIGRTVRLACSMLINKLVFYEALRKVYGLPALTVPRTIHTGQELRERLKRMFDHIRENIDYESVFTEEFIDQIPFISDEVVELWRDLIQDIERFDFTRLDYDIIGNIFQRLIAPDERHKLGQYFTPSWVVDLINVFCIRSPDARVLDPGCGAGTFLVRAYNRLKQFAPSEGHEDRLQRLWGIDIARYPAHLSVINLASRDFSSQENYPRIIKDNFFNVQPRRSRYLFHHRSHRGPGLRTEQVYQVVPMFTAVVGNPPYTRQSEMDDLYAGAQRRAHDRIFQDWRIKFPRRASIHALFLLHGAAFLEEGGRIGFLMHSSWVDVDYGMDLQRFLLEHMKILAILEPQVEHWFPGVDVNTSVIIAERCADPDARANNLVRFVQVKVPLARLLEAVGGHPDDPAAYERVMEAVLSAHALIDTPYWRIFPITQRELWEQGLDENGTYQGTKWGIFLRAPEVFSTIISRLGERAVKLRDLAEIKRGFTTGANEFFYVRDVTDSLTPGELRSLGLSARKAQDVRVIETEDGDRYPIEAKYLQPALITTRRVNRLEIQPEWITHHIFLATEPAHRLSRYALRFVTDGETRPFGRGTRSGIPARKPTCAARDPWYGLDPDNCGDFLWFMNLTNIHAVPRNTRRVYSDARFYNIRPRRSEHARVLFGLLNSTFTFLCAELWGRQFAGRGMDSIDIKVYEVKALPAVNINTIPPRVARRIEEAVETLTRRTILTMPEELARPDRQALDDAVLEAMGFADEDERRRVREALYAAVSERIAMRRARALSTREHGTFGNRRQISPAALAAELVGQIDPARLRRFPDDFIPRGARTRTLALPGGVGEVTRQTVDQVRIGGRTIRLDSPEAAEFVECAVLAGARGEIQVPSDPDVLRKVLAEYRQYVQEMERTITQLAESRTRDRRLQRRIQESLRERLGLGRPILQRQLPLI